MLDDTVLEEIIYTLMGAESAIFMSQPIKGTEIVMPTQELDKLGKEALKALKQAMDKQAIDGRIDELEKLNLSQDAWGHWVDGHTITARIEELKNERG